MPKPTTSGKLQLRILQSTAGFEIYTDCPQTGGFIVTDRVAKPYVMSDRIAYQNSPRITTMEQAVEAKRQWEEYLCR